MLTPDAIKIIADKVFNFKNKRGKQWKSILVNEHWKQDGDAHFRQLRNQFELDKVAVKIGKATTVDEIFFLLSVNHENMYKTRDEV